jgi:hypothetical protein
VAIKETGLVKTVVLVAIAYGSTAIVIAFYQLLLILRSQEPFKAWFNRFKTRAAAIDARCQRLVMLLTRTSWLVSPGARALRFAGSKLLEEYGDLDRRDSSPTPTDASSADDQHVAASTGIQLDAASGSTSGLHSRLTTNASQACVSATTGTSDH